jgi:hypothetical protein
LEPYVTLDLTTPVSIPNGTKLDISRPDFDDEAGECNFVCVLRTGNATAAKICQWGMVLRDGQSVQANRQLTPAVGLNIDDLDRYVALSIRDTPTGYKDALDVWRAGNTNQQRRAAFAAHLVSAGHLGPGFAGT